MSSVLVVIVGLIYLGIGVSEVMKGNYPMGIVFLGYAASNVGFYLAI